MPSIPPFCPINVFGVDKLPVHRTILQQIALSGVFGWPTALGLSALVGLVILGSPQMIQSDSLELASAFG